MIAHSTIVGGRYRVVRALGGGGMKLVYLAEDLRLAGRSCALAEMVDSFTSPDLQEQAVAAFQREADMLAQLANEHIPRIFDRFSEANRHYLVMEYIDGDTLEDELRSNGGKLPPARVIEIALQILTTLEYLHNLDPPVIYRDLKPSNVMVTRDGMAKLIDFGIARHFAPLSNATMIGTQGYAPPEQYRGRVETRSDLYALGATMHHALSGRDPAAEPPFSFPPLRKLCPYLDPSLAAVVNQALAYDVVNRMRDATEFKRRLIEIESEVTAPPSPPATRNRSDGRPQLPLPLGAPPPVAGSQAPVPADANGPAPRSTPSASSGARASATPLPAPLAAQSASAPTVLSVATEIKCPSCARMIPIDSRFCSYCAADLRNTLNAFKMGPIDAAETIVLDRHAADATRRGRRHRTHAQIGGQRSCPRLPHPVLIIAAIFAISFIIKMIVLNATMPNTPPPQNSGSAAPPGNVAPDDNLRDAQLSSLREALDDGGFTEVQFRLNGNAIELWGTVPNRMARHNVEVMVQAMLAGTVGISMMRDNVQIR